MTTLRSLNLPDRSTRWHASPRDSRCENCGSACAQQPFADHAGLTRCARCGGWSAATTAGFDPEITYGRGYFDGEEYFSYDLARRAQRVNFRRKLEQLSPFLPTDLRRLRVFELGAATGEFLSVLCEQGCTNTLGVEVSRYARETAVTRGFRVRAPHAPELPAEISQLCPDLICAWDVWEHLEHPFERVRDVVDKASRRCVLAITTVDASSLVARVRRTRWRQFHPPTHLHYPSRASFRLAAAKLGFRVVAQHSFGMYRPMVEYVRAAVGTRAARIAARAPHIASLPIYLNLHDIQLVILTRP